MPAAGCRGAHRGACLWASAADADPCLPDPGDGRGLRPLRRQGFSCRPQGQNAAGVLHRRRERGRAGAAQPGTRSGWETVRRRSGPTLPSSISPSRTPAGCPKSCGVISTDCHLKRSSPAGFTIGLWSDLRSLQTMVRLLFNVGLRCGSAGHRQSFWGVALCRTPFQNDKKTKENTIDGLYSQGQTSRPPLHSCRCAQLRAAPGRICLPSAPPRASCCRRMDAR